MHLFHKHHHLVGGTLLIAGMSIGVGMLALPVVTAASGFIPSLVVYLLCWLFMIGLGMLLVEACLWMPTEVNLIGLTRHFLGSRGAALCWGLYLFLFYCLMIAHIAAGGSIVMQGVALPFWLSTLIYVAAFAPVVYLGTKAVDRVNIVLMTGVALLYILFIFIAASHVQAPLLARSNWSLVLPSLPVILTSFGFQNLIPTLVTYMERDHKKIRRAIWLGTSIPLLLYVAWELLVLGIVPLKDLMGALKAGQSAVVPLQAALPNSALSTIAGFFSFFAMTTSFVGISIAFFDFWADGLEWKKQGMRRIGLLALVFAIPLGLVFIYPSIFLEALGLAGGFGMILLLGILPITMVWIGRYKQHKTQYMFFRGGKKALLFMLFCCVSIIWIMAASL